MGRSLAAAAAGGTQQHARRQLTSARLWSRKKGAEVLSTSGDARASHAAVKVASADQRKQPRMKRLQEQQPGLSEPVTDLAACSVKESQADHQQQLQKEDAQALKHGREAVTTMAAIDGETVTTAHEVAAASAPCQPKEPAATCVAQDCADSEEKLPEGHSTGFGPSAPLRALQQPTAPQQAQQGIGSGKSTCACVLVKTGWLRILGLA